MPLKTDEDILYEEACTYYDKREYIQAFKIFLNLANKNNSDAQNNIACMYIDGFGTEKNEEKAVYWWDKAIKNDNENSEYHLGYYKIKIGLIDEGFIFLEKAYEHCQDDATFLLAEYYYNGTYVNKDIEKSKSLYGKAIIFGNKDAIVKLITLIYNENGRFAAIKKVLQLLVYMSIQKIKLIFPKF